jgi:hypothetical protein
LFQVHLDIKLEMIGVAWMVEPLALAGFQIFDPGEAVGLDKIGVARSDL